MTDDAFDRYQEIQRAVHHLVDKMTEDLSPQDDDDVRERLSSEFRFWRRQQPPEQR